ncbi:hypothetical protein JCM30204_20680 [Dysgonomonas termitidis]
MTYYLLLKIYYLLKGNKGNNLFSEQLSVNSIVVCHAERNEASRPRVVNNLYLVSFSKKVTKVTDISVNSQQLADL